MSESRSWAVLVAALTLVAASATAARAQLPAPTDTLVVLRGSDTLAVERFSRAPGRLDGTLAERLTGTTVRYHATLGSAASVTVLRIEVFPNGESVDSTPARQVSIAIEGDTAVITAGGAPQRIASEAGAFPYINLSFALLEQAVRHARALGGGDTVGVPFFIGGRTATATFRRLGGDSVSVTLGGVELRAVVDSTGRLLAAGVPAQGLVVRRNGVAGPPVVAVHHDYAAPPGAPYTSEEVIVPGPAGALAGTLTLPKGATGRLPAVVTITGSGPEDRDEAIPGVTGYRPFAQIADTLSRRGIAVLRMDDRGFGESKGTFAGATSEDFANDIRAAVRYLRSRPDIDPGRIALVGHSEGGLIAPMVAATDPRIRAIALLAGPAVSGRTILEYQYRYMIEGDTSRSAAARDSALARTPAQIDSAAAHDPWLAFFMRYDPLPTARKVKAPVLILQGATDQQVHASQASQLAAAFRAGGNRDVTVHVFPDRNHLFLQDPTGDPRGYADLPNHKIGPDVLGTLADWMARQLRAAGAAN